MIELSGDLFNSDAPAIGHGVNCKGVMGAGIAVEFARRFPTMYESYRQACLDHELLVGDVCIYRVKEPAYSAQSRYVCNIASQHLPGRDAREDWLYSGVLRTLRQLKTLDVERLALPRIGCGIGGLDWDSVRDLLVQAEERVEGPELEIWSI